MDAVSTMGAESESSDGSMAPNSTIMKPFTTTTKYNLTPNDGAFAAAQAGFPAAPEVDPSSVASTTTTKLPRTMSNDVFVTFCATRLDIPAESFVEAYANVELRADDNANSATSASHVGDATLRRTKPKTALARICIDAFVSVIAFCEDRDVISMATSSRTLRLALLELDAIVWRARALHLWCGKQGFAGAESKLVLPRKIVRALVRATAICDPAPPDSVLHGLAHSWRSAYFVSMRDAKRDFLTDDELFDHHWRVDFASPVAVAAAVDAQQQSQGMPKIFRRRGHVKTVQPVATLPAVPCQLFGGGRRFQVDVYPAHKVERRADWGWRIVNNYIRFETVAPPERHRRSSGPASGAAVGAAAEVATTDANSELMLPAPARTPQDHHSRDETGHATSDDDDDGVDADDTQVAVGILLQGASALLQTLW